MVVPSPPPPPPVVYRLVPGPGHALAVTANFPAGPAGKVRFCLCPGPLDRQDGGPGTVDDPAGLTFQDAQGHPLPFTATATRGWEVDAGGRPFSLRYRVTIHPPLPDLTLVWGWTTLVVPRGGAFARNPKRLLEDALWLTSWDPAARLHGFGDLQDSLAIGGPVRVARRLAGDVPVTFAVAGSWRFPDGAFEDAVVRLVGSQVAAFGEPPYHRLLVTLTPATGSATGASAVASAVSAQLDPANTRVADPEVLRTVAREHARLWIGRLARADLRREPGARWTWFSEGFTEYEAALSLLRTGLASPDWFRTWVDDALHDEATSPSAAHHGALLALFADERVRDETDGHATLDDALRQVFDDARQGEPLDAHALEQALDDLTGSSWRGFFAHQVEGGTPLPYGSPPWRAGVRFAAPTPGRAEGVPGGKTPAATAAIAPRLADDAATRTALEALRREP